jgi:hypothetical protein
MLGGEHERLLRDVGLGPAALYKWREVLSLAGGVGDKPPSYWKKNNWGDAVAMEPHGYCRFPRIADLALSLAEKEQHLEVRLAALELLADFPLVHVLLRLGELLLDADEDAAVRNAAAACLGGRQLGGRDRFFVWSREAIEAANGVLLRAFREGMMEAVPRLSWALRHVDSKALDETLCEAPVALASQAVDAYASKALALRLLQGLPEVSSANAPRLCGLVAHVLGKEAAAPLLAYAEKAPLAARAEAMLAALSVDADLAGGPVDAWLATMPMMRTWAARAAWHRDHPGVLPVARAFALSRALGVLPVGERARAATEAAAWFHARASLEPFSERAPMELWAASALACDAPEQVVLACDGSTGALDLLPALSRPYVAALVSLGRTSDAEKVAVERSELPFAAWTFARVGLPNRALRIASRLRSSSPESVAAQALALSRLGHLDLARRVLASAQLVARPTLLEFGGEQFPGPDEVHRAETEPDLHPLLAAIVRRDVGLLHDLCATMPAPGPDDPAASLHEIEQRFHG